MLRGHYHPTLPRNSDQRIWHALLKRFGRLLNSFQEKSGDPAYWYGERSLTGLLAAAAWSMKRGGALEEFLGMRRHGRNNTSGRGDAWIYDKNRWYTIEAKARWPRRTSTDALVSLAGKAIEEARKQLQSLDPLYKKGTLKTAICYIIPELAVRSGEKVPSAYQTKKMTEKLCQQFAANKTIVGAFWCTGKPPRYPDRKEGKTYMYPGVIVVLTWWKRTRGRQYK